MAALCLLALVCWAAWLLSRIGDAPRISDVQIDPDSDRSVQVQYGDDPNWRLFYDFPRDWPGSFADATLVNADGRGRRIVVVGSNNPLDDNATVLVGLDGPTKVTWRQVLHSELRWPDCYPPSRWWVVRHMTAAELDGLRGEELVVVSNDVLQYPTRISIVEPGSGGIRCSFWHFGQINAVRVLPGFFEDGRPAILAHGLNNKLDGFDDGLRDIEVQRAHWDIVGVVMILDPLHMEGLGPPRTERVPGIPAARPIAYAFLDMPYGPELLYVPEGQPGQRRAPPGPLRPDQIGAIEYVEDAPLTASDGTAPWFGVMISTKTEDGKVVNRGYFLIDRNLELRQVPPPAAVSTHIGGVTKEYWDRFWHPIIQSGEYVGN